MSTSGSGSLAFEATRGKTFVTRARANSPLRILTPRNHGHGAWAYVTSFGGGMVDQDELSLDITVEENATAFVATQGPLRVFRSPAGCTNRLEARVADGGLLVHAPEPVALFAEARLEQRSHLELQPGASLLWLDILGAGRPAYGDRWSFALYSNLLSVRRGTQRLVHERLLLSQEHGPISTRMGRFGALGMLLLAGPRVAALARELQASIHAEPIQRGASFLWSASPLADDVLLVKAAAERVDVLVAQLHAALAFLPSLLGDDPLGRRWDIACT